MKLNAKQQVQACVEFTGRLAYENPDEAAELLAKVEEDPEIDDEIKSAVLRFKRGAIRVSAPNGDFVYFPNNGVQKVEAPAIKGESLSRRPRDEAEIEHITTGGLFGSVRPEAGGRVKTRKNTGEPEDY